MEDEIRGKIINAAIAAFNEGGSHFTMDSVANSLKMSKKTIYKYFKSKDDLIEAAVNSGFDAVKLAERSIIDDPTIDTVDKLKKAVIVIPDQYRFVDWRRLYEFKDSYPKAFEAIQTRIETGWESTIELLEMNMREGKLRQANISIIKSMIESCIEGFLRNNTLIEEGIGYEEALNAMIEIIIEGLRV